MNVSRGNRYLWLVLISGVTLLVLAIWQVNRMRPPGLLRLATGPEGRQSAVASLIYKEAMAERGFDVELIPTGGSAETIRLLQESEADAGFFDNAAAMSLDTDGVVSLAAIYPEPVWIFYRSELEDNGSFDELSDLSGRVAIGDPDSGANRLARLLFEQSEIDLEQLDLVALPDTVAAGQLLAGELDAAIMVGGINSRPVLDLLLSPQVELLNIRRVQAFNIIMPYLESVLLPEGAIHLNDNRPAEDKNLLATQSVLVARQSLHPDLQWLLLTVAEETHEDLIWFEMPGQYPTTEGLLLELSPTAAEYHDGRVTVLEKYLPFWVASPLERFYLLLLPLLVILYPLVRTSPRLYSNIVRRRIYRWYQTVRNVELGMADYDLQQLDAKIQELRRLHSDLIETVNVPTGYLESFYNLRVHIQLVVGLLTERKRELLAQQAAQNGPAEQATDASVESPLDGEAQAESSQGSP